MATVFQARPRSIEVVHRPIEASSAARALAELDAAARRVVEATSSEPDQRRQAVELLALHARRISEMDQGVDEPVPQGTL